MAQRYTKDPDDVIDFKIDWARHLAAIGDGTDTIDTSSWSIETDGSGMTIEDDTQFTDTTVTDGSAEEVDAIVYSAWQRDYDSVLEIGVFTDLQKAFDALEVKPEEMVKVRPTLYVKDSPRSSWQSVGVTVETLNQIKRKPDYEWWYKDPAED